MKSAAVRTHLLEHRLAVPFESALMRFDRQAHVLVEVECGDGWFDEPVVPEQLAPPVGGTEA
jgi:hypothetical protein